MSQDFTNFRAVPFIGPIPQPRAVGLCAPAKSNCVPIIIDWIFYAGEDVIEIDLGAGGNVSPPLQAIRSVIIDNTFCQGSVQIRFPDTGFVVQCAQDTSTSGIVLTNSFKLQIRQENTGLTQLTQTTIYLCDFMVDTYVQERLSPTLQLWRGSQSTPFFLDPVYAPPALGQRKFNALIDLGLVGYGNGALLFDNSVDWTTIVLKSFSVSILGNYRAASVAYPMQIAVGQFSATPRFLWSWYALPSLTEYNKHLATQDGLNAYYDNAPTSAFNGVRLYNALQALPGASAEITGTYDTIDGEFIF